MAKKDSYWFRHDTTAGRGLKLRYITHIYGHAGKGFYWDVVEILREQENYQYRSDDTSLQILASIIGVKDEKTFLNWFKTCVEKELFVDDKTHFFCPPLTESMKFWDKQKANGDKGGRPTKTQTKPKRNPVITQKKSGHNHYSTEIIEQYNMYISHLNLKTGKKYRGSSKAISGFNARGNDGYSLDDFKKAIDNAVLDEYHIEQNFKYLSPEFFTRADKLDKFINAELKATLDRKTHSSYNAKIERDISAYLNQGWKLLPEHEAYLANFKTA